MSSYRLLVLSNPVAGREDEYNTWYSQQHIRDVAGLPGFTAAQRFKIAGPGLDGSESPYQYAAIYEIETEDLAATLLLLGEKTGTDAVPMSEAIDTEKIFVVPMAPITERVTKS